MQFARALACAVLVAAGASAEARACTWDCPDPNFYPAEGKLLPRNAAVRVLVAWGDVTVTVDGQPATAVEVPELSGDHAPFELCSQGRAFRIEPPPPVGATATFHVSYASIDYPVGPDDVTPPRSLADMAVDVHDHLGIDSCSTCGLDHGLNLWVRLVGGEQDEGSAIVHNIYLNTDGDGSDGALMRTVEARSRFVAVPLHYTWPEQHDPLRGFCVTVRTFDLAGNQAYTAHRVCSACRARIDVGEELWCAQVETMPDFSLADTVPGGQCTSTKFPSAEPPPSGDEPPATDSEADNGEVASDPGCNCDGTAGTTPVLWLLLVLPRRRYLYPRPRVSL